MPYTVHLPPSLREVARRKPCRRECHIVLTTLPQSKIIDFCQPPLGGGQVCVHKKENPEAKASGFHKLFSRF